MGLCCEAHYLAAALSFLPLALALAVTWWTLWLSKSSLWIGQDHYRCRGDEELRLDLPTCYQNYSLCVSHSFKRGKGCKLEKLRNLFRCGPECWLSDLWVLMFGFAAGGKKRELLPELVSLWCFSLIFWKMYTLPPYPTPGHWRGYEGEADTLLCQASGESWMLYILLNNVETSVSLLGELMAPEQATVLHSTVLLKQERIRFQKGSTLVKSTRSILHN